ncbi:MAG: PHP domain-containing protein, partial [Candidatus Baltobacteraceae bacterium]
KRGILAYKGRLTRTPMAKALVIAREIMAFLAAGPTLHRLTYAGSLRRAEVTVGDIDIVCTAADAQAVITRFVAWERAQAVLAEGPTKASIWLEGGLQIDLRVLPDHLYGNLLQHFTGSREHNIQLREYAVRKGFRVSENGIVELQSGRAIACQTEEEVYAALEMEYIPPELRCGIGEIELARAGTLPRLIEVRDLRGDFHMHCTWSDGRGSLEEMIAAAAARGYEYHSISDHSQGRGPKYGMTPQGLREQRERVREIGQRFKIRTLCSSEVDILPDGSLDFSDEQLASLDIVVASVHSAMNLSEDEMTRRLIRACENPYVAIIGHPTGRMIGSFAGYAFDYDAVFAAAARTGTALEIDGQALRLDLPSELARRACAMGVTFSVDSDAHDPNQLANVELAISQARRAGLTKEHVLNTRPLAGVLSFVEAKRKARA